MLATTPASPPVQGEKLRLSPRPRRAGKALRPSQPTQRPGHMGKLRPQRAKGWPTSHGQLVILHLKMDPQLPRSPCSKATTLGTVAPSGISPSPGTPTASHCRARAAPGSGPLPVTLAPHCQTHQLCKRSWEPGFLREIFYVSKYWQPIQHSYVFQLPCGVTHLRPGRELALGTL